MRRPLVGEFPVSSEEAPVLSIIVPPRQPLRNPMGRRVTSAAAAMGLLRRRGNEQDNLTLASTTSDPNDENVHIQPMNTNHHWPMKTTKIITDSSYSSTNRSSCSTSASRSIKVKAILALATKGARYLLEHNDSNKSTKKELPVNDLVARFDEIILRDGAVFSWSIGHAKGNDEFDRDDVALLQSNCDLPSTMDLSTSLEDTYTTKEKNDDKSQKDNSKGIFRPCVDSVGVDPVLVEALKGTKHSQTLPSLDNCWQANHETTTKQTKRRNKDYVDAQQPILHIFHDELSTLYEESSSINRAESTDDENSVLTRHSSATLSDILDHAFHHQQRHKSMRSPFSPTNASSPSNSPYIAMAKEKPHTMDDLKVRARWELALKMMHNTDNSNFYANGHRHHSQFNSKDISKRRASKSLLQSGSRSSSFAAASSSSILRASSLSGSRHRRSRSHRHYSQHRRHQLRRYLQKQHQQRQLQRQQRELQLMLEPLQLLSPPTTTLFSPPPTQTQPSITTHLATADSEELSPLKDMKSLLEDVAEI